MDQTQLLDWGGEDDPCNGAGDSGEPPKPVGRLHLLSNKYGPEKDYWIYPGENVIGRSESCQVCLPASSVSKSHAVIEVPSPDGPHLLYDRGSLNKTRRQRLILKPEVRYCLQDGDALLFGDVGCQYFVLAPGGASESSDESMEVPPTQRRPDTSALVIEETPAPGRRMGLEMILVQDSEQEEDGEDVGKGPGRRNGSDPAVQDGSGGPFKLACTMFPSPSAAVVPESDEESGDASVGEEPPCPSRRLCFESQDAELGRGQNGGVPPPDHQRHSVEPGEPERATKAHVEERTAKNQEVPLEPLVANVHLDSDTDEEAAGAGASEPPVPRRPPETSTDLEVGSDTDEDEPVAAESEPDRREKPQSTLEVGSDTDAEEMAEEGLNVPQNHRPDENGDDDDDDTDAEEGMEGPSMADPGGRESCPPPKEGGIEGAEEGPALPQGHPLGTDEGSDTDVEEAAGQPEAKSQKLPEMGDGETDVEEEEAPLHVEDPEATVKAHESACERDGDAVAGDTESVGDSWKAPVAASQDSDGDTDVEMADLVLENSDAAPSPRPGSTEGSRAPVEEVPLERVVQPGRSSPGDGPKDPGMEAENPRVEFNSDHPPAIERVQSLDGKPSLENTAKGTTLPSPKPGLAILSVDSDTDVEEEAERPDGASEEDHSTAGVGSGGGSFLGNAPVGAPKSPMLDSPGGSDTDLEGTPPSRRESVAQDSDTDLEEASGPWPGKPLEEQDTQLLVPREAGVAQGGSVPSVTQGKRFWGPCKADEDTDTEGNVAPPADDDSNTDDDPDLAFQTTQCFLPPESSSPMPERAHNAAVADSSSALEEEATQAFIFQSPVATRFPLGKACSSPFKEENRDLDASTLEATQSFCQESDTLSEEATQAFAAPEEEEEVERVPQPGWQEGGGGILEEHTASALSVSTSRGQQATSLSPTAATEPSRLGPSSSELVPHAGTEGGVDPCEKKEETEPAPSALVPSGFGGEPTSASREALGNLRGEVHVSAGPPEAGSTAGSPQAGSGGAGAHHQLEDRTSALAGKPRDVTEQVPDGARPELPAASGQRRSQRLASAPATPPAPPLEGRSLRRRDRGGSVDAEGSSQPAASLSQRRGRRELGSASQSTGEPEAKKVPPKEEEEEEEEEEAGSRKKPRNGEPPAAAPRASRARFPQRDPDAASRLKGGAVAVAAAGSPGTRERTRRGKPRTATEPAKEQQQEPPRTRASRRSNSTSGGTPSPKDSGKDVNPPGQESPAPSTPSSGRRLRRQSIESQSGGTRAQTPKRMQGSSTAAPKVLFTGVIDEEGEHVVTSLGGSLAESVFDCTHLVTDRVRRTVKFLCALARGIPIVTPDWLEKSRQNSFFLVPTSFLVRDPEQEKNFGFSLAASLQIAQQEGGLFQGYEVHVTLNVKPEPEHMRDIVKCSGGTFLPRMPRAYKDKRVVVSCPDDLPRCKPARDAGIPIADSEFILTGLLQQRVDLQAHRLDGVGVSPVASPAAPTRTSKRRAGAPTAASAPAPTSTAKRRR